MHDGNCLSILYEQMNVHMSLTQLFKVEPKFYPQIQHRCVSSSLWAEPTNKLPSLLDVLPGPPILAPITVHHIQHTLSMIAPSPAINMKK